MKIAVFDTYVTRRDGRRMHFDILVPDGTKTDAQVLAFGEAYLRARGIEAGPLTTRECRFCHTELANEEIAQVISADGVAILELENCD
ncbi:DUF2024 family protein [Roseateles sp. DC23W]|uniref:DUF2024 family protein n=1 Tax=Pelomonas dachongensis TaxID=3299029 RepID=A0ABW7EWI0_9BURK